jgi:hypothetical protein
MDALLADEVGLEENWTISPELALVDPDLRAVALAQLTAAVWEAPRKAPADVAPLEPPPTARSAPFEAKVVPRRAARRPRRFLPAAVGTVAAACLMLAVLEAPSLVHRHAGNTRAAVVPGRLLTWAPSPRARGYRVLVVAGERVVVDTATSRPSLRLDLLAGSYRWWVWPVMAGNARAPAVVQASLEVPAA